MLTIKAVKGFDKSIPRMPGPYLCSSCCRAASKPPAAAVALWGLLVANKASSVESMLSRRACDAMTHSYPLMQQHQHHCDTDLDCVGCDTEFGWTECLLNISSPLVVEQQRWCCLLVLPLSYIEFVTKCVRVGDSFGVAILARRPGPHQSHSAAVHTHKHGQHKAKPPAVH